MTALFIAVEGPNGVGKTTAASGLGGRLAEASTNPTNVTTEPTRTTLGTYLRSAESGLTGRAFALAIAADRYVHIEQEIRPKLRQGVHVITDRYVQSSLVLQRIDGLDLDEIWLYNRHALVPALTFYLEDDPATIRARLAARESRSRLELEGSPEQELDLYRDAYEYLAPRGWTQHWLDCRGRTPEAVVAAMMARLQPTIT